MAVEPSTASLARFAAGLRFEDIPAPVVRRAEDLALDWAAAAIAGRTGPPVEAMAALSRAMGPDSGPAEVLPGRRTTSALLAAMENAAASHYHELDAIHNRSVLHPATVVLPAALALAQAEGRSGRDLLAAIVAGFEVGIRVGEYLGRSHYQRFHTTATAGTLAAAAAAGRAIGLAEGPMLDALGSAGTLAAGLWEFLPSGADSKPLHTGHAASAGVSAAWLARAGLRGARAVLEGPRGMGAVMSTDRDPARLCDGLGSRFALAECSIKCHASVRHAHPAADAFSRLLAEHRLPPDQIAEVTAHVHQAAIDLMGPMVAPASVPQAKFSLGTTLGLLAWFGAATPREFAWFADPRVVALRDRVKLVLSPEVERAYPARWTAQVTVRTTSGQVLEARAEAARGDPEDPLDRAAVLAKARALVAWSGGASEAELDSMARRIFSLSDAERVERLLPLPLS